MIYFHLTVYYKNFELKKVSICSKPIHNFYIVASGGWNQCHYSEMIYFELTGYYLIVCLRYAKRSYINSCVRCDIQCDIWKNAKSLFSDNKRNRISCHISLSDKLIHR